MIADLREVRGRDSGILGVNDEDRKRICRACRPGTCGYQHKIGDRAIGDVKLAAVEHEIIAVPACRGADATNVASRIGLGQAERADAPPLDSRLLELGLLLRRSQIDNRAQRQVLVGKHPGGDASCCSRQLLIEEAAHQQVAAPAADSLRIVDAEVAGLSQ